MKQILLFFYINLYSLTAKSLDKSLRIFGGRDALPDEFPFVLKMEIKVTTKEGDDYYRHLCTCSVLKPTWSLTAAHCIQGLEEMASAPHVKGVIRHNFSSDQESSYSNILSMLKEPNFRDKMTMENDIGLLLSETITVSRFAKFSSVDYFTLYGTKVLTLGYGRTEGSNGTIGDAFSVNKPLQVLDAVIVKCPTRLFSPSFCLGGICGLWPASHFGDSGGPVLHVSGIVGVCSGQIDGEGQKDVGMFTPGSAYVDWIANVINSIAP